MIQIAVCDDNPTIRLKIIGLLKEYALSQSLGIELKQMDGLKPPPIFGKRMPLYR